MVRSLHQAPEVQELPSLAAQWAWQALRVPVRCPSPVGGSLKTVILCRESGRASRAQPSRRAPPTAAKGALRPTRQRTQTQPPNWPLLPASRGKAKGRGPVGIRPSPSSLPVHSLWGPRPGSSTHLLPSLLRWVGWGGDEPHDSSCPRGRGHLVPHILKTLGLLLAGGTEGPGALSLQLPTKPPYPVLVPRGWWQPGQLDLSSLGSRP